jgi:hypothetical protein
MRTLPRPLIETVVLRGSDPTRLVTASPALREAPGSANFRCTTTHGPCRSDCTSLWTTECCEQIPDWLGGGLDCTVTSYTDPCCPGQDCCNGRCTNFSSSETDCGGCGRSCETGRLCCGGTCINPETDPKNCGACGRVCTSGHCQNGTCPCPPGFSDCYGLTCCPPGLNCSWGLCCPPGKVACVPEGAPATCCTPCGDHYCAPPFSNCIPGFNICW